MIARIVVVARSIAGCTQVEHQKQAAVPAEGQHGLGLHTGHTVKHTSKLVTIYKCKDFHTNILTSCGWPSGG